MFLNYDGRTDWTDLDEIQYEVCPVRMILLLKSQSYYSFTTYNFTCTSFFVDLELFTRAKTLNLRSILYEYTFFTTRKFSYYDFLRNSTVSEKIKVFWISPQTKIPLLCHDKKTVPVLSDFCNFVVFHDQKCAKNSFLSFDGCYFKLKTFYLTFHHLNQGIYG